MKTLAALLFPLIFLTSCDNSGADSYRTDRGQTWGTFYNITYRSDTDLSDSIRAVMASVDSSLSVFNASSLLARINRGETAVADSLFAEVFTESQRISALSGGRFDPTVMPLVELWGFGPASTDTEPTRQQIDSALLSVGIGRCSLDPATLTLKRPSAATTFDFSAIAKGYGCDLVARMLRRNGCTDYLIEIGGEIALSGLNPQGEEWRVQIDAPVESKTDMAHNRAAMISITGCGIASSGNYRNYRDTGSGKRIGHTISPLTGLPVASELLAVTVIAPTTMTADALATACMAMPRSEATAMIESLDSVEALFIAPGSGATYSISTTSGFPAIW